MRTFKALVKREYWEHRGAMFITPTAMTVFFAALLILGLITSSNIEINGDDFSLLNKMPQLVEQIDNHSEEEVDKVVQLALYSPIVIFGFVMFWVGIFYAVGCLYDERKDRSILFWKSLPLSDTQTVLSKFFTVIVVIPVLYFCALLVFQIYSLIFGTVLLWFGGDSGLIVWSSSNLFVVAFNSLMGLIISNLWLAPLWGWLMFASAWAKKVAILWGTLPVLLVGIAEGTIFNSTEFLEMVGVHIARGGIVATASINNLEKDGYVLDMDLTSPFQAFAFSEFWIGLVVAAVFLAGAIYIRRNRDEA
ncbi:hypothetical protein FLL45_20985 [Aliikangiella marina]|uniref:ABC transporter permease subunit n=1 Tax=Aliikangiella marina TaxID=1712262 RepID=A0A545T352_9GAMM|nr:ABC-2 transporter permease [Aliikangiella marina]TQV71628.1 hypothetical protein FLL45_20985 [Aliikangiella marina]